MKTPGRNIAASVRARLHNLAEREGRIFDEVLTRFALERLLYRLSVSPHRQRFILKGALLLSVWFDGLTQRITRDADLLGQGSPEEIRAIFEGLCESAASSEDGLRWDASSIRVEPIRAQTEVAGLRVLLLSYLEQARIHVQVDIGIGDALSISLSEVELPSLLDLPRPKLLAYAKETSVAEKVEAMVRLGMLNSRLKDYFDLWILARTFTFEGHRLSEAMRATFLRRGTPLPADIPPGLSEDFARERQVQWERFWQRSVGRESCPTLDEVIRLIASFVVPPMGWPEGSNHHWDPGGPWRVSE